MTTLERDSDATIRAEFDWWEKPRRQMRLQRSEWTGGELEVGEDEEVADGVTGKEVKIWNLCCTSGLLAMVPNETL